MIRGVIFDMDGTLFDTERLYTIAWKQVGEEMGYSITTELLNQCRGKTAAIIRYTGSHGRNRSRWRNDLYS